MEITKTFNRGTRKERTIKFDIILAEKGNEAQKSLIRGGGYDFWEPEEGGTFEREAAEELGIDTSAQFFYVKWWDVN